MRNIHGFPVEFVQVQAGEEYETVLDLCTWPHVGEEVTIPGLGSFPALVGSVCSVKHHFGGFVGGLRIRVTLNTLAAHPK